MPKYDYLIVGAGLFGSVCAYELSKLGKRCLIIDQRNHIGGNCYTQVKDNIEVHMYGAHIFHTSNQEVWDYINQFTPFIPFINQPISIAHNHTYNLPFNMNLFTRIFGLTTPEEVRQKIQTEIKPYIDSEPTNLEEQALKLVGPTIYNIFIKGYTQKQWGKPCKELPTNIITRLPLRFTYDNNYFEDTYQGIPQIGYTAIFNLLLSQVDVLCDTSYQNLPNKIKYNHLIYTGMIDEFYNYKFGPLNYRSLQFIHQTYPTDNYQGNAVVNYADSHIPYTRTTEHRFFKPTHSSKTIVSYEFPTEYKLNSGLSPDYPYTDKVNHQLYSKYIQLNTNPNIKFAGRLGLYQYLDMDDTIQLALNLIKSITA